MTNLHPHTYALMSCLLGCMASCTATESTTTSQNEPTVTSNQVTEPADETRQPHILWIVTDDQRADSIACFNVATTGQPESPLGVVESPNVDALAAQGTLFVNAFCQSPGCAPSRASMHFGLYPHHSGVYGFTPHHPNAPHLPPQLPVLLADAGYDTFHVGKLGVRSLGWDGEVMRWQDASHYATGFGFRDVFDNAGLSEWDKRTATVGGREGDREIFRFPDGRTFMSHRAADATPEEHAAELAHIETINQELDLIRKRRLNGDEEITVYAGVSPMPAEMMRDSRYARAVVHHLENTGRDYETLWGTTQAGPPADQPIFVHIGFDFPHTPVIPPADIRARFHERDYNVPVFDPALLETLPPQMVKHIEWGASHHYSDAERLQMVRDYYAFCAFGDAVIGELIEDFKAHAEATDRPWLILYICGDHGWSLNEHGKVSKFTPWDLSIRTPVIVASSDTDAFPPGEVVTGLVELVDIAPTALAAAGEDLSTSTYAHLDGRDLARIVSGDATRTHVLGEIDAIAGHRGYLRTDRFAYSQRTRPGGGLTGRRAGADMHWAVNAPREDVEMAFYDLSADPEEMNNLANHPDWIELVDWFRLHLQEQLITFGRVETDWRDGLEGRTTIIPIIPNANRAAIVPPAALIPGS